MINDLRRPPAGALGPICAVRPGAQLVRSSAGHRLSRLFHVSSLRVDRLTCSSAHYCRAVVNSDTYRPARFPFILSEFQTNDSQTAGPLLPSHDLPM